MKRIVTHMKNFRRRIGSTWQAYTPYLDAAWSDKRDKRVVQGAPLLDECFNETAKSKEVATASTVREIQNKAKKRRACAGKKPERPGRYPLYEPLIDNILRSDYPQGGRASPEAKPTIPDKVLCLTVPGRLRAKSWRLLLLSERKSDWAKR